MRNILWQEKSFSKLTWDDDLSLKSQENNINKQPNYSNDDVMIIQKSQLIFELTAGRGLHPGFF